jgi:hypothetical protein
METGPALLPILKAQGKHKFERFVTGDESRFTLELHHSTKWSVSRDDRPQKVKQQIGTQNFMLTVIWGMDGFHLLDLMTEQHSYTTQYFLSHILESLLLALFPDGCKPHFHCLSLHLDNLRLHCSRASENFFAENSIMRVPHPPYCSDLAPSGFWLFGDIKAALAGQPFPWARGTSHWHSGTSE